MILLSHPPTQLVTLDLIQGPERCVNLDSGLRQNDEGRCNTHFPSLEGRGLRGGGIFIMPPHPDPLPRGEREAFLLVNQHA